MIESLSKRVRAYSAVRILKPMESPRLTDEQHQWLTARICRQLRLLTRLRDRLERRGFRLDDPLYLRVCRAWDAVHQLRVRTHYAGCKNGVGRSS